MSIYNGMALHNQGFIQWEGKLPPPSQRKGKGGEKERERERGERERGGSVHVFGGMIYLITLRLAEYHRLISIPPQRH